MCTSLLPSFCADTRSCQQHENSLRGQAGNDNHNGREICVNVAANCPLKFDDTDGTTVGFRKKTPST